MQSCFHLKFLFIVVAIFFQASCSSDTKIWLTDATPNEQQIIATIQTGTEVMNPIEGEKLKDERWYKVQYRADKQANSGELKAVAVSEIPSQHQEIPAVIVDRVDVGPTDFLQTPKAIAAKGYSAVEKSGDQYLCEKSYHADNDNGPWAIMTAEGKIKAEIQSIDAQSLGGYVDHSWNPATSQVVFRPRMDIVPPPNANRNQLNPVPIKVWTYQGGQQQLDSYMLDLSQAFDFKDKRYVPKPGLLVRPRS